MAKNASKNTSATATPASVTASVVNDPEYGPMISLSAGTTDKWPFRFGPAKAHKIVAAFAQIKAFAEANPMRK